jgi:hypothetical protein
VAPEIVLLRGPAVSGHPAEVQAILGEVTQIRLGLTAFFGCPAPAELRVHRRWAAGLGARGARVSESLYGRIWHQARAAAIPGQAGTQPARRAPPP